MDLRLALPRAGEHRLHNLKIQQQQALRGSGGGPRDGSQMTEPAPQVPPVHVSDDWLAGASSHPRDCGCSGCAALLCCRCSHHDHDSDPQCSSAPKALSGLDQAGLQGRWHELCASRPAAPAQGLTQTRPAPPARHAAPAPAHPRAGPGRSAARWALPHRTPKNRIAEAQQGV